jgi:protein-S-isoprenylcysteine O-methyltransferase Ste14
VSFGGALLLLFGTPLLHGSSYGLALAPVLSLILAIRAHFEERTLTKHFPEYEAYLKSVRYRFVPFIWQNGFIVTVAPVPAPTVFAAQLAN